MKTVRNIVAILILVAGGCSRADHRPYIGAVACCSNLRILASAKQQWRYLEHKATNDVPVMTDLTNYMAEIPVCPSGGMYTLGPVWKNPTCSVKGHEL